MGGTELRLGASAIPVYERVDQHTKMHFAMDDSPIKLRGDGSEPPIIRVLSHGTNTLRVGISWDPASEQSMANVGDKLRFTMSCSVISYPDKITDKTCPDVDCEYTIGSGKLEAAFNFTPPNTYLPWGMRGDLCFHYVMPGLGSSKAYYPVELYFIPDSKSRPDFYYRGLPVDLMRKFLLPLRKMVDEDLVPLVTTDRDVSDNEDGWLRYVIDKLHHQKNIKYNSFGGGRGHYYWGQADLLLDQWVSDVVQSKDELRTINCYDLAALAMTIVPLGLREEDHKLQMKQMLPFGFIKPTMLIGRGRCNSPFAEDGKFDIEQDNKKRTWFREHVFMTIAKGDDHKEMVLDATCRPLEDGPHAGQEDLQTYIDNSIDPAKDGTNGGTTLYEDLKGISGPPHQGKNTSDDVNNWSGVRELVTQPEVFAPSKLHQQPLEQGNNILANVASMFPGYRISEPNIIVRSTSVTTDWYLVDDSTGDEMKIVISRSLETYEARNMWEETREVLAQTVQLTKDGSRVYLPGDNDRWAVTTPRKQEALWAQGTFFVHLRKKLEDGFDQVVESLQSHIASNVTGVRDLPNYDLAVDGPGEGDRDKECKVGDKFRVTMRGVPEDIYMPINVEITDNKVLYMNSERNGDNVSFWFMARAVTTKPDMIQFRIFDASLSYHIIQYADEKDEKKNAQIWVSITE